MLNSIWTWITASTVLLLGVFRGIFARRIRLGKSQSHSLWEQLNKRGRSFVLDGEEIGDKLPSEHKSFSVLDKILMMITIEERFLRAGRQGTDSVVFVTVFRWKYAKFMRLVLEGESSTKDAVPIYIMRHWDASKIGTLTKSSEHYKPYMPESVYQKIERSVSKTVGDDAQDKTGVLLYGPPGNGKSYFVRYLATKYRLPVYVFLLEQDTTNLDIVMSFSHVRGPCIVLFEDFDSYFKLKSPCIRRAKHTLDSVLNILDGMYYTPAGVVFMMTVNELDKVDDALKSRPSRFEYVTLFDNPDAEMRRRILGDGAHIEEQVAETAGMSLDQVLNRKREVVPGLKVVGGEQ